MNCIGCGLCASICPHVFELHDGRSQIIEKADLKTNLSCIKEAIMNCPIQSIEIKDFDKKKN